MKIYDSIFEIFRKIVHSSWLSQIFLEHKNALWTKGVYTFGSTRFFFVTCASSARKKKNVETKATVNSGGRVLRNSGKPVLRSSVSGWACCGTPDEWTPKTDTRITLCDVTDRRRFPDRTRPVPIRSPVCSPPKKKKIQRRAFIVLSLIFSPGLFIVGSFPRKFIFFKFPHS